MLIAVHWVVWITINIKNRTHQHREISKGVKLVVSFHRWSPDVHKCRVTACFFPSVLFIHGSRETPAQRPYDVRPSGAAHITVKSYHPRLRIIHYLCHDLNQTHHIMLVSELSPNQFAELKQSYYCNVVRADEPVSYGELCDIDKLVTDKEILDYYAGTNFVAGDFFST